MKMEQSEHEKQVLFNRESAIINKGERFKMLMKMDLYTEAMEETKQRLFQMFQDTYESQKEEREHIFYISKALEAITNTVDAVVSESETLQDYREND